MSAGTLLGGKYRLEALIGRGGMGSVWRAQHLGLHAPVAVKLLNVEAVTSSSEMLNRFHREARAAAAIRSPHVVQILDHGIDEASGAPFIVMELMEGQSLADRLERDGRINPADTQRIFTQVARALSRAHEVGIVHRDLKPDNVFLVRNEDEEVAKVLDFGIAKAQAHGLDGASATMTGAVMGTAYYMSPEQISGDKNVDFRTDLWAFGVMACECLTGRRPFDADTIGGLTLRICIAPLPVPSSFGPVPAGFDAWFAKIVNRDPGQRFASAREAAEALRSVCSGALPAAGQSNGPVNRWSGPPGEPSVATGASFTRTSADFGEFPEKKSKSALFLIAGVVVVALAGAWGLGHALGFRIEGSGPPSSADASVSTAATAATAAVPHTVASAERVCELNATRCLGTTPQICGGDSWMSAAVTAGQCGAVCTPNVSPARCEAGGPQLCAPNGQWQASAACTRSEQCRDGECVPTKQTFNPPNVRPAKPASVVPAPAAPAPAVAAAKPDCDPSYTLDSDGQKHFKPECFK